MNTLPVSIGKLSILAFFILLLPMLAAAKKKNHHLHFVARASEKRLIVLEAAELYAEMQLKDSGLNEKALQYALLGYHRLLRRHALQKTDVLSVCDFSQPSSAKRMYVLDLHNKRVIYRTYVAHGMGSGREYANSFSNVPDSYKSSLGFYVTRNTYVGSNGLSLRICGVEKGFNDKAQARSIVIHGANYVSERVLHKYGLIGTTFGCPAVPEEMAAQIIPVLKNGTCFFIFYPSKRYLGASKMLNG
jgi:L,D-transpeptidase catalytic domain